MAATTAAWSDPSSHQERYVTANGIRLEVLDWGGSGPALILIHGLGDNPHIFDDLAPAFTDRFHVIAYARRGHGHSQALPPYDTATLTEDLRGLMDALRISRADLVGWSMGGNEITSMAVRHPERVGRIVYFDGIYDYADPAFRAALGALPAELREIPASAFQSLDAYRAYEKKVDFAGVDDMGRIEAYLRELVTIQKDGSVKHAMPKEIEDALFASLMNDSPKSYARVRCPALAINAQTAFSEPIRDPRRRELVDRWEKQHLRPFKEKSLARARQEMPDLRITSVPGSHVTFFLVSRGRVVKSMRHFLAGGKRSDSMSR